MAAGLGFKTFNTGDVLSAADVNGYLMQGVLVFADATARDAAITSPQEGQFAYTKNNDSLWYYSGSAWVASGATGDIEGVTAGTGISGGGTSGTVTITNSMATAIDAKGDLVVGTGADTFSRLAVGTNGYLLTADSTEATGMKWAAASGGGKVLQVVGATYSTETTVSSTTFIDTGLTATITPTANTSKILVLTQQLFRNSAVGADDRQGRVRLVRDSTTINYSEVNGIGIYAGGNGGANDLQAIALYNFAYLDSPATTSATTYKTQHATGNDTNRANLQNSTSSIILLEIGA